MPKLLMKGNEAVAEAAVLAGCRYFFGYPITPQNQIPEYLSERLPQVGGVYLQAESEISAINMVYGSAATGARVMTSSSSPGISLKQEGISYLAGARLPCVIVNMMRGGPGLGGIQPGQADYFQATRGGGNGDYRCIVLAPSTVQEACDLTGKAFDLADEYRMPVIIVGDGFLGQMMEPVELPAMRDLAALPQKPWAATGFDGSRPRNVINSLFLDPKMLEDHNIALQTMYDEVSQKHAAYATEFTEDATLVLTAYGTTARIARSAVTAARAEGLKVGLVRPITLWPFPVKAFDTLAQDGICKTVLTVELSMGQMVEDVRLAANGRMAVALHARAGGMVPSIEELLAKIHEIMGV